MVVAAAKAVAAAIARASNGCLERNGVGDVATVAVVTVVVTAVEEGFGRGGVGLQGWMCRVSSDGGCQKIAKAT